MDLRQRLPTIVKTQGKTLLAATFPKERVILTVEKTGRICLTELLPTGNRILSEATTTPVTLATYSSHSHRVATIDLTNTLRVFQLEP